MDSNTTISGGIIFILFCIILYVLVNRSKKKKEKQFLIPLRRLAEKDNCEISHHDIWSNSIIGTDNLTNHVYFIKQLFNNTTTLSINLNEILKCRMNEVGQTVALASRTKGIKGNVIKTFDKVELVFINRDKNKSDVIAEFYNKETGNPSLSGEFQMAEKWCKIANDRIALISK
jgi:hypothetical protein